MKELTPREIMRELDRYIIGQAEAKRAVAIALRNRYRRRSAAGGRAQRDQPQEHFDDRVLRVLARLRSPAGWPSW